jgi:DNA repair exonuclease SbcCD ATPase subunit
MSQEYRPQPSPSDDPNLSPQGQEEQEQSTSASTGTPAPALQEAVQHMWDVVRKGADIIVTLRQENTILQSQISALRRSEQGLQVQVEDFLTRISTLEEQSAGEPAVIHDGDPGVSIDRLEDRIKELEASLAEANAKLAQTTAALEDQAEISQQLMQMRSELEVRTQMLAEFQSAYVDRFGLEPDGDAETTISTDTEAITGLKKQLDLFGTPADETADMSAEELNALAGRLDRVAQELDELFRLS